MRDRSLIKVSLAIAAIVSVLFLVLHFLFPYFLMPALFIGYPIIAFVIFMGLTYLITYSIVNAFLYKRIKTLYKLVNLSGKGKKNETTEDSIEDLEQEVKKYAFGKDEEIDSLKKMKKFRRDFLGDVSHELKTPIFNTQGYIETLLAGAINDEEVNISYLKKASENLDRLNVIVEELLSISMHEVDELDLEKERFNFIQLLNEVYEEQEMTADLKDFRLLRADSLPNNLMVHADKKRIKTVLNNLVNNSIKYGKEGGFIKIKSIDLETQILVEVSDNGHGIEEKDLPRLFERFFRIDKHRSRAEGGTGLGLAICKHILEAHNQTIRVRSEIDKGSTFSFTLDKV